MPDKPLSPQQDKFVRAYLRTGNGTQSAIEAGYSRQTAYAQGSRLLKHGGVRARLHQAEKRAVIREALTAQRVVEEMRRLAMVDIRDYYDAQGNVLPVTQWTPEMGACVGGMELIIKNAKAGDGITDEVLKIKLWDKTRALDLLAKHFGLLVTRIEVSNVDQKIQTLHEGRAHAATLRLKAKPHKG